MADDPKITAARAFVRGLNVLLKSIRLYGFEHERVTSQSTTAWDHLRATLAYTGEAPFVLGVSESKLLLDGTPLGDSPVEQGFAKLLSSADLSSIQFSGRVTQEEFSRFVRTFAAAGPKPKNLAEQLKAALGRGSQAGIRVNEVRFVTEDEAMADARVSAQVAVSALGFDAGQMQSLLDDPQKLLQFIAATAGAQAGAPAAPQAGAGASEGGTNQPGIAPPAEGGTPTGVGAPAPSAGGPVLPGLATPAGGATATGAGVVPLQEEELTSLLRLLAQLGQAGGQSASPGMAGQVQQQFANLPTAANATLQQALAALSTAAPVARPDAPMLLRLAENLAIRHALDRYQQGDVEVNAVRELLNRMSGEIITLRKLMRRQEAETEGVELEAETDSEDLENQFWAAMPEESMRSVLLSTRAWCVPPRQIRKLVEALLDRGDSDLSTAVLVNYAACIENPNPDARQRAAQGLSFLSNLYVHGYSEVLGAALHHLREQLSRETAPELQQLLSQTFIHFNREVTAVTSPAFGSFTLTCYQCGDQRLDVPAREELVELLRAQGVHLFCSQCEILTPWLSEKPEQPPETQPAEQKQPADQPQRRARRARMKLSIRVRSEAPELPFTEVNATLDVSRLGALFLCSHPLRKGMEVFVQVPYNEGDALPETRAQVVRVRPLEEYYEVAVQFIP
ncbi:MAG: PilZ domain-containing protein [Acidobacteria bacterium]|nr:PilZ domain-containing protein [Acidobacteriota bacterium]